jgi:hypothetical protein
MIPTDPVPLQLQQTFAPSMQDQLLYTDSWAAWMAGSRNSQCDPSLGFGRTDVSLDDAGGG